MRTLQVLVMICLVPLTVPSASLAQVEPPTEWQLLQSDPEPFMPELEGPCRFTVEVPQAAYLELWIWSESPTEVVKLLTQTTVPGAGIFAVFWDGKGSNGEYVLEGSYTYTVHATDGAQGPTLFEDSKVMYVFRVAAVEHNTWSAIKRLFR